MSQTGIHIGLGFSYNLGDKQFLIFLFYLLIYIIISKFSSFNVVKICQSPHRIFNGLGKWE